MSFSQERNGRYYAQMTVEDPVAGIKKVRRVTMEGVNTDARAVAKLQELLTQRRKGTLPVLKRTPLFAGYATQYFDYYAKVKDARRESTLATERIADSGLAKNGHQRRSRRSSTVITKTESVLNSRAHPTGRRLITSRLKSPSPLPHVNAPVSPTFRIFD